MKNLKKAVFCLTLCLLGGNALAQAWTTSTITSGVYDEDERTTSPADVGRLSSLALDSNGDPFVAYFRKDEPTEGNFMYAFFGPDANGVERWNWELRSLDEVQTDSVPRMDVTFLGDIAYIFYPRVINQALYYDSEPDAFSYKTWSSSSGESSRQQLHLFFERPGIAGPTNFFFDSDASSSRVHVVHRVDMLFSCSGSAAADRSVVHRWLKDDGTWGCAQAAAAPTVAGPVVLAVDSLDRAHTIYAWQSSGQTKLRYRRANVPNDAGTHWSDDGSITSGSRNVTGDPDPATIHLGIDTDSTNNAHICFYQPYYKTLYYYRYLSTTDALTTPELIDGTPSGAVDTVDVGQYCDIEADSTTIRVIYYDAENGGLKYATRPIAGGAWTLSTIDNPAADVGQFASAEVDSAGVVHVTYYDATNGDLKYAHNGSIPVCGDGAVQAPEQCDDGNGNFTDACVNCRNAVCGDDYVRFEVEFCDEGDQNGGQFGDCNMTCTARILFPCEDGLDNDGDTLIDTNDPECHTNRNAATPASYFSRGSEGEPTACGDGTCDAGESCSTCAGDCGVCGGPFCGDGTCGAGETEATCPRDCEPPICPANTTLEDGVCVRVVPGPGVSACTMDAQCGTENICQEGRCVQVQTLTTPPARGGGGVFGCTLIRQAR